MNTQAGDNEEEHHNLIWNPKIDYRTSWAQNIRKLDLGTKTGSTVAPFKKFSKYLDWTGANKIKRIPAKNIGASQMSESSRWWGQHFWNIHTASRQRRTSTIRRSETRNTLQKFTMSTKHLKTWCLVHWDCGFFQERPLQTESPKKNLVKVEFIIEMMRTTLLDTRSGDTEIKYIKIRYSETQRVLNCRSIWLKHITELGVWYLGLWLLWVNSKGLDWTGANKITKIRGIVLVQVNEILIAMKDNKNTHTRTHHQATSWGDLKPRK